MPLEELKKRISALEERVRILENRLDELNNRFESFRINMINTTKKHDNKIKTIIRGTAELSKGLKDLRRIVEKMETRMLKLATKAEVKELEAYLTLIDPINRLLEKKEKEKKIQDEEV